MAALQSFSAGTARELEYAVTKFLRKYETSQVNVQVVTTVVPDSRKPEQSKVVYEAFVTFPL
ncbi:hypothetical protein [Cryobacterium sp. MDB2-10]|uniref:hypothetical protein n=1 Tax=Cryobacterium sp. MDB2-10 TaxID=1259177 RepID=UPI00107491E6|nr:hypothetical protein [Cryobacterium sp. MDB2-10]TFC19912.1 hypothetical protein E3O51_06125 [Cryobacterium sp. MDB2-10]